MEGPSKLNLWLLCYTCYVDYRLSIDNDWKQKSFIFLRFSYDELSAAVKENYCEEQATVKHYIMLVVEYFEAKLQVSSYILSHLSSVDAGLFIKSTE